MNPEVCDANTDAQWLIDVRAALTIQETIAHHGSALARLPAAERRWLHQVVGQIYFPDPRARRQQRKAAAPDRVRAKSTSGASFGKTINPPIGEGGAKCRPGAQVAVGNSQ